MSGAHRARKGTSRYYAAAGRNSSWGRPPAYVRHIPHVFGVSKRPTTQHHWGSRQSSVTSRAGHYQDTTGSVPPTSTPPPLNLRAPVCFTHPSLSLKSLGFLCVSLSIWMTDFYHTSWTGGYKVKNVIQRNDVFLICTSTRLSFFKCLILFSNYKWNPKWPLSSKIW